MEKHVTRATIEKAAEVYASRKMYFTLGRKDSRSCPCFDWYDLAQAYSDGARTALGRVFGIDTDGSFTVSVRRGTGTDKPQDARWQPQDARERPRAGTDYPRSGTDYPRAAVAEP